ncbi:MAG: hypothetical protein Q4C30_08770 [Bacteroidia bacterium]|nr:hypothetical protein [Bacteroidia bacterium]
MKYRHFFTLVAIALISIATSAQMYVWKDGEAILSMDNTLPDSITFQKPYGTLEQFTFSVASNRKVRFSKGNLQYNDYTQEWRFAEKQYNFIGADNANIAEWYNGWIDLFGWGTCGWSFDINGQQENHFTTETSTDYRDYIVGGHWSNGLVGDYKMADWGVSNSDYIINGDNLKWRTLTSEEWKYLLWSRPNADRLLALATVNGVPGLIILADDWKGIPAGLSFTPSVMNGVIRVEIGTGGYYEDENYNSHYGENVYTRSEWSKMEKAGALFLPAAGQRWGTDIRNIGWAERGKYYSTTPCDEERDGNVFALTFFTSGITPTTETSRVWGASVRLVHDIE